MNIRRLLTVLALFAILAGGAIAAYCWTCAAAKGASVPLSAAPGLVKTYCSSCHTDGVAAIDLDDSLDRWAVQQDRSSWQKAVVLLRNETMPPKGFPQPTPAERECLIRWLETELAETVPPSRFSVRRLQRIEFQNCVRDLLCGAGPSLGDLPEDEAAWRQCDSLPPLSDGLREKYRAVVVHLLAEVDIEQLVRAFMPEAPIDSVADAKPQHLTRFLARFSRSAYRRPLTAEELATLAGVFAKSGDFNEGIRRALGAVLLSPPFLYRIESNNRLSEVELASRLSFFLWQSGPDDELLSLAERRALRDNCAAQARRMLRHPRAGDFANHFAAFWLDLDRLKEKEHLEPTLAEAMRQETERFVSRVVHDDRSVMEFLDSDYTFVNERLARHYGMDGIAGAEWRRVPITDLHRGSLLTQASVLAVTARHLEAKAVGRGRWILEKFIGPLSKAPPTELLATFEQIRKSGSDQQRLLAQHRKHDCAYCHAVLDGLGLALENFDGLGLWHGVDSGDVEFPGPAELKSYLLRNRRLFIRSLTGRLLSYALGRTLHDGERAMLERISRPAWNSPYFSNVLVQVVLSEALQRRVHANGTQRYARIPSSTPVRAVY